MARKHKAPDHEEIIAKFERAYSFNEKIGLYDQVRVNEDFFIGKQWEGVRSNGHPTPSINIFKRIINFQVSTITSDNLAIRASGMPSTSRFLQKQVDDICEIINQQLVAIMERCKIVSKNREFLRDAAVTGDGCLHYYFDPTIRNGQDVTGEIQAEVLSNLRVHFGNPNSKDVQSQPYIILSRRDMLEELRWHIDDLKDLGKEDGEVYTRIKDTNSIQPDSEKFQNDYDSYSNDKVTVLTYYWRNRETKTIWCMEVTETEVIREPFDTELKYYPLVWLCWDHIRDCYHGQAMVTGLLDNQKAINKLNALTIMSLMTLAFPKVAYDKTKIKRWTGDVGVSIGVNGNVDNVAKVIEGASVSPQVSQFIELFFDKTHSVLGASDVAMGDSRPDNTSAIIALQRAANTPMELVKQNNYQALEDSAIIFVDMMRVYYGIRMVEIKMEMDKAEEQPLGMNLEPQIFLRPFDFSTLDDVQISIRIDVGASSYWSELANVQTLENLLMNDRINTVQFLERLPDGYLAKKQELIDELKASMVPALTPATAMAGPMANTGTGMSMETTSEEMPVHGGSGNGSLQRALNAEGA